MIKSDSVPRREPIWNKVGRKIGYFVTIIVNCIVVVIVRTLPDWNLSFLNDAKFEDWLPYFYLSVGASILANMLLLGIDPYRLRHLMQIFINVFSLISVLALILIFPFHFKDDTLDTVVHIALWLGVLGIGISFLTDGTKTLLGERKKSAKAKEKSKIKNEMFS